MASDRNQKQSNSLPISFPDEDDTDAPEDYVELVEQTADSEDVEPVVNDSGLGGPDLAELVASRAELKRLQNELGEAKEGLARRQADFENYRKRIERERGEAYQRVVADVARKLLPVLDNLNRALDAEKTVQAQ